METSIASAEEIIDDARNGRMFILADDASPENGAHLVIPAQMGTPAAVNFMARYGRGLVCLALTRRRSVELGLDMQAREVRDDDNAYAVSIEAATGVSTGISAADRARTIAVAIDGNATADDIVTPGHMFPVIARDGGVLVRAGAAEAAVDIARLAGLNPSGVICAIMREDGNLATLECLGGLAAEHDLRVGTISDLIAYRRRYDHLVKRRAELDFVSQWGGEWKAITFQNTVNNTEAIALIKGPIDTSGPVHVRMHVQTPFADVLGELREGHSSMIQRAMTRIGEVGSGVVVLLSSPAPDLASRVIEARQTGREDSAGRRVELREYGIGAQILNDLGITRITLLTNRSHNLVALAGHGIAIEGEDPLPLS
ncbi:3,4-dihydroxy-2-butanone-4-phosphate synthase [Croceicoccus naphthovorans]|uniref:3,4-dihydroxy-2-butanone-4-phosphate synthase n=1 Tax=Croceicoccus naphthovorans TaxID=1348774 RepID=UPI002889BA33|nr:3,4-dihydroxy-2-butanone-4-phosphate synthase [Croceicoccus naphthovorans]